MLSDPIKKNNVTISGNLLSGSTLIFSHGFGTDQTSWTRVVPAFEQDHRVIRYDNTGGGKADPDAFSPNKYDTLDSYADDLVDICESLRVRDAVMIAHSVSGMISLITSLRNPEYFKKIVLVGASPRYLNDIPYIGGLNQSDLEDLYQAMNNNYFAWVSGFAAMAMENPENPQLAESFASTLASIRPDIAQSVAKVIFESDYRHLLKDVDTSTLILQTEHDIAVPRETAEYLHRHIKDSKLAIIDARGHFPQISAPAEIIKAIKEFIG
ncbi:alpha/beta fold hydrolase [Hufsiella ginkgonis]|uniref:Alpha/beta fold hydrolase n=1 Tax=Hufsiella ginkgonis TaxID=2695274 RepID=A0A7K1XX53_9SPHI|nr:alpha/beta hydrolase [Hufsiella ginkgonis]MXV15581.1 alpha/beta fold hydrolase [Hufsiella ginkgonis]